MVRLMCCLGVSIAILASGSVSAGFRDIVMTEKFCADINGKKICTPEAKSVFKVDWPGKVVVIEFLKARVRFGSTIYINEPPVPNKLGTMYYTEPTKVTASVRGHTLTVERTSAAKNGTWFQKSTDSYVLEFGPDGKCRSYKIASRVLEPTSDDSKSGLVPLGCEGTIDLH